jgi:CheY-like chemotaxis protein
MVQERVPDLMLLDLAMPEVTGREVLHELRRNRRTRNLPVLVMSAYTRVLPPDEAGFASGVISKPLVVANLLEEIRRVLGEEGSNRSTPSK